MQSYRSDNQQRQHAGQIRYALCRRESGGSVKCATRKLTGLGVKPVGELQWQFLYRWLYGIVEPLSGEDFMLGFSHLDSFCFEEFLQAIRPEGVMPSADRANVSPRVTPDSG